MAKPNQAFTRIASLFAVLVILFLCVSTTLLAVFADEGGDPEPGEESIKIFFTNPIVQVGTDGIATFTIELDRASHVDITVFFHTENRSAIAGDDYMEVNSSVVIPAGTISVNVAVLALHTGSYATSVITDDGEIYNSRYFALVLDRFVKEEADEGVQDYPVEIDPAKKTAYGYLRAQRTYSLTVGEKAAYLSEYANVQTATHKNTIIGGGKTWKSWEHGVTLNNQTTQGWVANFINTGLAKTYVTMLVDEFSYDDWYNSDDPEINMGNAKFITSNGTLNKENGLMVFWEIDPCNGKWKSNWADELNGEGNELFAAGKDPHDTNNDWWKKDKYTDYVANKKVYFYNDSSSWFASSGSLYHSQFYYVEPYNGTLDVGTSFKNCASSFYDYRLNGLTYKMLIRDEVAPTLVSSYLDSSSLISDGRLRLILRFSEPVYVSTDKSSIAVRFNGGNTAKYFTYAGGNYTDTLFYELDKVSPTTYSSYSFSIENSKLDRISDLSYNLNFGGKIENNVTADYTSDRIDIEPIYYEKPIIKLTPDNSDYANYHEVDVSTGLVTKGTLYYLWDENPGDVTDISKYGTNRIDFTQPLNTISLASENGSRYLHVLCETPYGLSTVKTTDSPLRFDNTAPTLTTEIEKLAHDLKVKKFTFSFADYVGTTARGDGIGTLVMKVSSPAGSADFTIFNAQSNYIDPSAKINFSDGTGSVFFSLTDIDSDGNPAEGTDVRYTANQTLERWMKDVDRREFLISFLLTDDCGNRKESDVYEVVFDKRDSFDAKVIVHPNPAAENSMAAEEGFSSSSPLYNVGLVNKEPGELACVIKTEQPDGKLRVLIRKGAGQSLEGVTFNGAPIDESGIVNATADKPNVIALLGLTPGYYSITPYFVLNGEGPEELLVTNTDHFYVTADYSEITNNYKQVDDGNLVLRNNVLTLETPFYYLGVLGSGVKSHQYGAIYDEDRERYVGGSASPAFSSKEVMLKYIEFMEYQDMMLVELNDSAANMLNLGTGSTDYVKADNERTTAKRGQYWIRYKRSTWTPDSSSYGWAFYYYSDGGTDMKIDKGAISNNLRSAIYAVRDKICATATVEYLVGEPGRSSATGAPKLDATRMHFAPEEVTVSHLGTQFASVIKYAGDPEIYSSMVKESDGVERPLATNLKLKVGSLTKLYYHYGPVDGEEVWNLISAKNDESLARAMSASKGIYTILEIDEFGAHKYELLIDTEAPHLTVIINESDKNKTETPVDSTTMQLAGKSLTFVGMYSKKLDAEGKPVYENIEVDSMAYVAVYNSMGRLLNVYYSDTISGVKLSDNNYQIEVGDRSGNVYLFNVRLVSDELQVVAQVTESKSGVYVEVKDRTEKEIYRYEVKCNNVLVSPTYVERKLYTTPGVYSVYVRDIYGNEYRDPSISFNRQTPELSWFYQNSSGTYSAYNENSIVAMKLVDDTKNTGIHYVTTSTLLRFRMSDTYGKCCFAFTGLDEGDYSVDNTGKTVTIEKLAGWSVKVWYEDYPDCYETYVCMLDDLPPTITVEYIGNSYTSFGQNEEGGAIDSDSEVPSSLKYSVQESMITKADGDGAMFTSNYISVSATDNFGGEDDTTGVRSLTVLLNGKPQNVDPDENGVYHFSAFGEYRVTAIDLFGNVSVYTFVNTDKPTATFRVDGGEEQQGGLLTKFLGSSDVSAIMSRDGEIEILVHREGADRYFRFRTEGGKIYRGNYSLVEIRDEENNVTKVVTVVYDINPIAALNYAGVTAGKEFSLIREEGYTLWATIRADGFVTFRVSCEKGRVDFEVRATCGKSLRPDYCEVSLSRLGADIEITSGGKVVKTNRTGDVIYIPEPLGISEITNPDVYLVEEAFSDSLTFDHFVVIYEGGHNLNRDHIDHKVKGFYCLRVTDVYGITVEYRICYSDLAAILVTTTNLDGSEIPYSGDYHGHTIRANRMIRIEVFSKQVTFLLEGEEVRPDELADRMRLTFREEGTYHVTVIDVTGTETEFTLEIGTDPDFNATLDWFADLREEGVLNGEYFTNQRVTLRPDLTAVKKIAIRKDGTVTVVYDVLSQTVSDSEENLTACVGKDGDGVYEICFYDAFGDVRTLTVHYRENPALRLTRITSYGGIDEEYPIARALKSGFYSSNALTFSTVAEKYVFTVNGEQITLDSPKMYEFHSSSGNGSFEYAITYSDIYGFSYSFTACLMMQTIEINTDAMALKDLGGVLHTRGNVLVTFPDDCTGFVSYNDRQNEEYISGTSFRKDGSYRFTVVDIAGNVSTVLIVRDSIVEYSFYPASREIPLHNGYVVNDSSVGFSPFVNDTAHIVSVFLNGKEKKDYSNNRFSETGLWEIILEDDVGNLSYFSFYLINHALSFFEYSAPNNYTVSEVWWSDKDGNRRLTTQKGDYILLNEDGYYAVIMISEINNIAVNFTVTIDTDPPEVVLVGCNDGEETSRDITLSGVSVGDTIEIYRDGALISEILIESKSDVPVITEPGAYRVVVRNAAGCSVEYHFTHKYVANGATSALIIIAVVAVIAGVFIGLIYRNRSKFDE